ncbi:4-hydroxy-tetrahydrodipicolinate synthase [Raineyella fluvialis]|uniref:4-hydroxy-tetrahydrodipicolinate synthase n=1 Tax=Raineyella fluvialis TaxID=2662261 RepID=A0A5Q2FBA7_9ACTN|nr:4-hydroxy-tetrahydrodipicolinate synthase [Raineyella fluvialis]QGF24162.1 4-hydroxy-tetrahydrodipicolinate synthase [Raineyella fluvialis]
MTDPTHTAAEPPFGRLLTAMVTPFDDKGDLDLGAARALAAHLVDDLRHDGLVINGTTGEAPTTSDEEKAAIIAAVAGEVGDRAHIVAGVGTNSTRHTCELARQAAEAGADGLLVVTPYYSRPPQEGLLAHFGAAADATDLPVMVYDIPSRAGIPVLTETMIALADHPRIVAVKDAKGQLVESAKVMAATDLAYYAGDDAITLPLLSVGGVGLIGTSTHFSGLLARDLIDAWVGGDPARALELNRRALPVFTGVFAAQGCSMVKATLARQGRPVGGLRAPQVMPADDLVDTYVDTLRAAGIF